MTGEQSLVPSPEDPQAEDLPVTISKEEKNWAMFTHLSALLGFIGIPFANVIAPLVLWQIKKEEYPFAAAEGKEAVNFQISVLIYCLISSVLMFVVIGFFLLPIIMIAAAIYTVIAGIKAGEGKAYRYPLTIRFLS